MQHVLSTYLFKEHRLTTVWLDRIWDAGIPFVELFVAKQHLDYCNKAQIVELGHWFRDAELRVNSLHSPLYRDDVNGRSGPQSVISITEREKAKRIAAVDDIKRTLEIAEYVPTRYLIQHLGVTEEEFSEYSVDAAFSALEELTLFAQQRGVEILLENTPNGLASAERLLTFFELTHMELGVCLDLGHAHINEGIETAYRTLKPRIRSTHVHDNDGKDDKHLFPLDGQGGTIDWAATMDLLRSSPGQYPLVLELKEVPEMQFPIRKAQTVFERLEELRSRHES